MPSTSLILNKTSRRGFDSLCLTQPRSHCSAPPKPTEGRNIWERVNLQCLSRSFPSWHMLRSRAAAGALSVAFHVLEFKTKLRGGHLTHTASPVLFKGPYTNNPKSSIRKRELALLGPCLVRLLVSSCSKRVSFQQQSLRPDHRPYPFSWILSVPNKGIITLRSDDTFVRHGTA